MDLGQKWQLNLSNAGWSHLGKQIGGSVHQMLASGSPCHSPEGPSWDDVCIVHIFCGPGCLPLAGLHSEIKETRVLKADETWVYGAAALVSCK